MKLFVYIITFFIIIVDVNATPSKSGRIIFDDLPQNIPINKETKIRIIIESKKWKDGVIKINKSAYKYIAPTSDVNNLEIAKEIILNSGEADQSISIPIIVIENGEYEVKLDVILNDDNNEQVAYFSRRFGIVAEGDTVWFGRESVDHAIGARILYKMGLGINVVLDDLSQEDFKVYQTRQKEENYKRMKLSHKNNNLN